MRLSEPKAPPVCFGMLVGSSIGREKVAQSPHGRDGHAPFFCDAKSNFKETMVLKPQLIDDDVLGTADNFPDSDAFCEAQGFVGSLGGNNKYHTDAHVEDLIHLVHGDRT